MTAKLKSVPESPQVGPMGYGPDIYAKWKRDIRAIDWKGMWERPGSIVDLPASKRVNRL